MPYPVTSRLGHLGPRAQAAVEAVELTLRAELAEALLTGEPPPPPAPPEGTKQEGEPPKSIAALLLDLVPDLDGGRRKALAKKLLQESLPGMAPLSRRDRERLRRAVRPGDKRSMHLRMDLSDELAEIFRPPNRDFEIRNHEDRAWLVGLVREFWPGHEKTFRVSMNHDDEEDHGEPGEHPTGPPAGPRYLQLHLERVRCLETTTGEWREDTIDAGGVSTHGSLALAPAPQDADAERFGAFPLGDFAAGRLSTLTPLQLEEWDLIDKPLPRLFLALFTLAEKDPAGGFDDYLDSLLTSVEATIPAYIYPGTNLGATGSTMTAIGSGTALGVALAAGPPGWFVAGLVVAVAGLVAMLSSVLIEGNRDDIFDLREMLLSLDSAALSGHPFYGQTRSVTESFVIDGDGGRYEIHYFWQLVGTL